VKHDRNRQQLREDNLILRAFRKQGLTDNEFYMNLLRKVRHAQNYEPDIKYTYFNCDISGCVEKITFPVGWTHWRARIYFVQHDYMEHPAPSPYDCTGEKWTYRFHTTVLHGQVVIYHFIDIDL
jgi:hypothetical protein